MKKNQSPQQLGKIDLDYEDDVVSDHEDTPGSSRIPDISSEESPVSRDDDEAEAAETALPDKAAENDEDGDLHTPLPTRGPTIGKGQTKESIKQSGKIKVEYSRVGMMVGKPAIDISSLCGVLSRTSIPITYDDWRQVPCDLKERMWDIVNLQYELLPRSKDLIISMVGSCFRNFKYRLNRNYVLPHVGNKKLLYTPPLKYPSITKEQWRKFVDKHVSTDFKEVSDKKKQCRDENKHNHKLSRKGYRGLIQELCAELGMAEEDIDRSELWSRARMDLQGEMDPAVLKIAELIAKLKKDVKEGKLKTRGKKDILSIALGREPTSRTRLQGTGKYLPSTMYYHFYTGSQVNEEFRSPWQTKIEAGICEMKNLIDKTRPSVGDEASCSYFQEVRKSDEEEKVRLGECVAADGGEEPGDAEGPKKDRKRKKLDGDKKKLDGQKGRELIPIRKSPRFTPQKDVNKDAIVCKEKLDGVNKDAEVVEFPITTSPIEEEKGKSTRKALDFDAEQKDLLDKKQKKVVVAAGTVRRTRGAAGAYSHTTRVLTMFARTIQSAFGSDGRAFTYMINDAVFGMPAKAYISKDDCEILLRMGWIENCHLETYSAMVYDSPRNIHIRDRNRSAQVRKFGFIHPYLAHKTKKVQGQKPITIEERGRHLYDDRLSQSCHGQWLFLVYNSGNNHWVLLVIEVATKLLYYLDSLNSNMNSDLKDLMESAMTFFAGCDDNLSKLWAFDSMVRFVKVPRQPGSHECGYYVMRFIKDIMDDVSVLQTNFNGKQVYTQAEIDEVRDEWAFEMNEFLLASR